MKPDNFFKSRLGHITCISSGPKNDRFARPDSISMKRWSIYVLLCGQPHEAAEHPALPLKAIDPNATNTTTLQSTAFLSCLRLFLVSYRPEIHVDVLFICNMRLPKENNNKQNKERRAHRTVHFFAWGIPAACISARLYCKACKHMQPKKAKGGDAAQQQMQSEQTATVSSIGRTAVTRVQSRTCLTTRVFKNKNIFIVRGAVPARMHLVLTAVCRLSRFAVFEGDRGQVLLSRFAQFYRW